MFNQVIWIILNNFFISLSRVKKGNVFFYYAITYLLYHSFCCSSLPWYVTRYLYFANDITDSSTVPRKFHLYLYVTV